MKAIVYLLVGMTILEAQTTGRGAAPATPKAKAAAIPSNRNPANLGQLMKGILYPNSNVVFAAQNDNPADVKPAKDPSVAINPLESSYGGWEAVENSALALVEAANLL